MICMELQTLRKDLPGIEIHAGEIPSVDKGVAQFLNFHF